jgi:hypothetical protein
MDINLPYSPSNGTLDLADLSPPKKMSYMGRNSRSTLGKAKEYLFGTFDRGVASTSWLMGFASLSMTGFLIRYPQEVPRFIVVRDLLLIFGFLSITLIINARYARRERVFRNQRAYLSKVIEKAHLITSKYHRDLFDSFRDFATEINSDVSSLSSDDIRRCQLMCEFACNSVRNSLLSYFQSLSIDLNGEISASVKLIVDSNTISEALGRNPSKRSKLETQDKWILTFARDRDTIDNDNREVSEFLYSLSRNSAYQYLFNSDKSYFCCDNLLSQTGYLNESESWTKFYNATVVVPIRYVSSSGSLISYGFITVDSPNKGGGELFLQKNHSIRTECLAILQHAADLLATHSLILRIQALALPKGG